MGVGEQGYERKLKLLTPTVVTANTKPNSKPDKHKTSH